MKNIKAMRREKEMTQAELAQKVGIRRESIARYESGERIPNAEIAAKIAKELDCTVEKLLGTEATP